MPEIRDVIVIGSGPAGLTAAIYAARANLHPLLIEGGQPGGQLMITSDIENFPGFQEPLAGPELMARMRAQAERVGADIVTADVTEVDFSRRPFKVWVGRTEYQGRTVILSTGASARWLGLESETRLMGRGVSACATCDGFFFKNKNVVVVGGGDTAMEEALYLSKIVGTIVIVHRRQALRASKVMQERAFHGDKIAFAWNSEIAEILGENKVEAVRLRDTRTGELRDLPCDGVFVAIGHKPNTELFARWIELDEQGYVKTIPGTTRTNVEGIYAAGDMQDKIYRQAVTAAGTGCMAALEAERLLATEEALETSAK